MSPRAFIFCVAIGMGIPSLVWGAPPGTVLETVAVDIPGAQAFSIDLARWDLRILVGGPDGSRTSTADEVGKRTGTTLVVNGGFFDPQNRSLGLLVDNGVLLNPLRKADWGVLSVSARTRHASVVHTRRWRKGRSGLPQFAIQSGPRLVVTGRPLTFKPQRARRTALGVQVGGKSIVFLVSPRPILTRVLAEAFVQLGCPYALNLDGGSSTQLWSSEKHVRSVHGGPVPNFVGVAPRSL